MKFCNLLFSGLAALALSACQPPVDRNASPADGAKDTSKAQEDNRLEKAQALSRAASQGNVQVVSLFDGPEGSDLVGLVIQPAGGAKDVAWANQDFSILFPVAIDKDGKSLNEQALEREGVRLSAEGLANKLIEEDIGFTVGTKGPVVTAFMDPNCIFCNRFYNEVMPLVKQGKLRVRYVMVGLIRPSSVPRSVAILAAKDPAKALEKDEKNFDAANEEGGITPDKTPHPEIEAQVLRSNALLNEAGPSSTPTLLLCRQGQDITLERGQPQGIQGFVASLDTAPKHKLCAGE